MNFIEAKIGKNLGRVTVKIGEEELYLSAGRAEKVGGYIGKKVWLGIRPENVGTRDNNPEAEENFLRARVSMVKQIGSEDYIYYPLGENQFISKFPLKNGRDIAHETEYDLWYDMEKCHIFDYETEENISL